MQNLPQRLFAVAAIAASLSFSLTPIVAAAKQGGRATTLNNLRRVGFAAAQYAEEYDGGVVLTQQGDAGFDKTWPVLLSPYLPDQSAYFDPTRPIVTGNTVQMGLAKVLWSSVTTIGINDAGYSGKLTTLGGTCAGRKIGYLYGVRNVSTMTDPEKRIAFAPTSYGDTGLGWFFFHNYDASWTKSGVASSLFSWNNMVFNTQKFFAEKKIPIGRADGSAGAVNKGHFKAYEEKTPTLATKAYCSWLETGNRSHWGAAWSND